MAGAQWLGWAPPLQRRLTGFEGLGDLAQGLYQYSQQQKFQNDISQLRGIEDLANFNPQSMAMQQMAGQNMMQALAPMTPYQSATLDVQMANAMKTSPTQQIARQKLQALNNMRAKLKEGEDISKDLEQFKALYGSGQTINVGPGTALTEKDKIDTALRLKKDFNARPAVEEYNTLAKNANRMEIAYKRATDPKKGLNVANDQALIMTFNKMLDESSVVRESEFARTPAAQGMLSRIKGYVQKVFEGGAGLTNAERQDIYEISQAFLNEGKSRFNEVYDEFETTADEIKLNKTIIFGGRTPFDITQQRDSGNSVKDYTPTELKKAELTPEVINKMLAEIEAEKKKKENKPSDWLQGMPASEGRFR